MIFAKRNNVYYNIYYRGDTVDDNLKRSVILEHYQHPVHRGLINDDSYLTSNTNSDSCIDACAICTSSTSIMIDTLIGKSIDEVKEIYNNYVKMIEEQEFDADVLEQAIVYEDISKQPNRKKCALLPWWGLKKIMRKIEEGDINE